MEETFELQKILISKALKIDVSELPLAEDGDKNLGTLLADTVLELHNIVKKTESEIKKKKQAEGIAAARARGVHLGRPAVKLPNNFAALKKQWKQGKLPIKDFLAITGLKESTLYRRLRDNDTKPAFQENKK